LDNIENLNDMNGKDIENINKPENNDNTQNVINEQEEDNNRNENKQINAKFWNGIDLDTLTVEKLKEELRIRKIDFPKNAKKKDLQDLLINSNSNK
jgi:hypothetical protein